VELLRSGFLRRRIHHAWITGAAFLRERQAAFAMRWRHHRRRHWGGSIPPICTCRAASRSCLLICRWAQPRMTAPAARCAFQRKREGDPGASSVSAPLRAFRKGRALAEIAPHPKKKRRDGASDVAGRSHKPPHKDRASAAFFTCGCLNTAHAKFAVVESFFREVVDASSCGEAGMRHIEIGTSTNDYAFIMSHIFEACIFRARDRGHNAVNGQTAS